MFEKGAKVATATVAMALACVAWGQEPSPRNRITDDPPPPARMPSKVAPHFTNVNFSSFAQAVGPMSGRTIVVGPGVCAVVSASWETELTGEQFYQEFVSIAHALGFIVVEEGSVTTINVHKDRSACGKYSNRQEDRD